jgi:hypothetical protein
LPFDLTNASFVIWNLQGTQAEKSAPRPGRLTESWRSFHLCARANFVEGRSRYLLRKSGAVEQIAARMNAGWVEPGALPSGSALGGFEHQWDSPRLRRKRVSAGRLWLAAGLAALAVAAIGFSPLMRQNAEPPAAVAAPPAEDFQTRVDLPALFYVRALEDGQAAAAYQAMAREGDGARKDALTLGDPFSDGPFLRATARIGGISPQQSLFFVDMARQAAEIGEAVARAVNPQAAPGGGMLSSEITLEAGGRQRACLGFRFAGASADLSGLACGGADQPLDRAGLECLISRVEPTAAGVAAGLDKLLKEQPAAKPSC